MLITVVGDYVRASDVGVSESNCVVGPFLVGHHHLRACVFYGRVFRPLAAVHPQPNVRRCRYCGVVGDSVGPCLVGIGGIGVGVGGIVGGVGI